MADRKRCCRRCESRWTRRRRCSRPDARHRLSLGGLEHNAGGLSNLETLKVATIFGAEAIGLNQDVGSLESGKLADLIILDKNPLDDIKNTNTIRYVMKNGELFEGDTLNQLWPKQKPLDPQYWWGMGPKDNLP